MRLCLVTRYEVYEMHGKHVVGVWSLRRHMVLVSAMVLFLLETELEYEGDGVWK